MYRLCVRPHTCKMALSCTSTLPAHLTWVRCFAPEIALALEARPNDSPGLPSIFSMRTDKYKRNVLAGKHIDETMPLPIRFFSRLLHQEDGLSPAEKTLTNEI